MHRAIICIVITINYKINDFLIFVTVPVDEIGTVVFVVDEFFQDDIIRNLVLLLGITEDQIRIVNVVRETSDRKKRNTESVNSFSVSQNQNL